MKDSNRHHHEEKPEAPEISEQSKVMKWLDNFWYHYKWQTILVAFILFVLIVGFVQCSGEEGSDVTVVYAGNHAFSESEMTMFETILGDLCPEDYDGSGDTVAAVAQFSIYNEEQLTEMNTFLDPTDGQYKLDKTEYEYSKYYNTDRYKNLQNYIMTGECGVWFVSPYVYEQLLFSEDERSNWVMQSVALKETAFYQYYDAINTVLPEDTILVLTVSPAIGYMSDAENHQTAIDFYNAIVNFVPQ